MKKTAADDIFSDVTIAKQQKSQTVKIPGPKQKNEVCEDWAMVVDDSPTVLSMVAAMLKSVGVEARTFRQAKDALEFLQGCADETAVTLMAIFSDLTMDGMSGVQFIQKVREEERFKSTPIVVVTGGTDRSAVQEVAKLGIHGLIIKPVSAAAIEDRVMAFALAQQKRDSKRTA